MTQMRKHTPGFQQPHREQPVQWHYDHQPDAAAKTARLTVSRTTGELNFTGGGIRTNGPLTAVKAISTPEANGDYAVFIEQSWLSNRAIADKGPEGFTVKFENPAPEKATLDSMLIR